MRVYDEVDMLVMHLADPTGERLDGAVDDALRGVRPLLRGYRISGDTAMLTPPSRDRGSWRRQLSADCR
ncbi:hypothetical protein [Blastococcus colisei]|uniref:hypothetical protein n=1 Tax=Blastococcus colisei TaxID=1564162 RepID=UPI001150D44C|nr:hypothetical protein [Blastococcus colisei]